MSAPELWIIATAALTATACALVGSFLVLRKMALIGDAISHAVLPGIAVAFFVTHSLNSLPMLIGAGLFGLLTVALIEGLYRTGRVQEDASIGVVFPALFALGVVLISRYAGEVHLDTDAALYGEIIFVPFNRLVVAGVDWGPRAVWMLGLVAALNLGFVLLFWKELKAGTFDPELAAALGLRPVLVQYLLMAAVSITTVAAFEAVGAILVVAMLIVPAATAYLLTDRLPRMLVLAVLAGMASAVAGYGFARWLDLSVSGSMAAWAGLFFGLAWLAAPRHGLVAGWLVRTRLAIRFAGDLLVMHLMERTRPARLGELAREFRWSPWFGRMVARHLERRGLVVIELGHGIRLTDAGRGWADTLRGRDSTGSAGASPSQI